MKILETVRAVIEEKSAGRNTPLRVAVNGIEGSGKTHFAENLTAYLARNRFTARHIPIDGFHHPRAVRYRQGRNSAAGYYKDAYDEAAFVHKVLRASQDDPPVITPAVHDLDTDRKLEIQPVRIPADTIIITDGAYLFKPVFRDCWDVKIFLKIDAATALRRGIRRDAAALGGDTAAAEMYRHRYHAAFERYVRECAPEASADIVIDNTDYDTPDIVTIRHEFKHLSDV